MFNILKYFYRLYFATIGNQIIGHVICIRNKNLYGRFVTADTALSTTYPWQKKSFCFWLVANDNWIFYCHIYACDWKNFSQTSLCFAVFQTLFSFTTHRLWMLADAGHTHIAIWSLVLNLWVAGKLARWTQIFQKAMPTWNG